MKSLLILLSLVFVTSCAKTVKISDFEFEAIEDRERTGVSYSQVASVVKTATNDQIKKLVMNLENKADFLYLANLDNYDGFDTISSVTLAAQYLQNPNFEKETFGLIFAATQSLYMGREDSIVMEYDFELNKNYHVRETDRYVKTIVSCSTVIFNFNCQKVAKAKYLNLEQNVSKIKNDSTISKLYQIMLDDYMNYTPEYTKRTQVLKNLFLNELNKEQKESIHFYSLFKEDYAKKDIDWKLLETYSKNNIHNKMVQWSVSRNVLVESYSRHIFSGYGVMKDNLVRMFKIYAKTEKIHASYLFKTLELENIVQFKNNIDQSSLLEILTESDATKTQYEFVMNKLVVNLNQKDRSNNSYLHAAAQFGDHKRITMLKNMGIKNDFNNENNTPFDIAIQHGYYSLAKKIDEREFNSIAAFLAKK